VADVFATTCALTEKDGIYTPTIRLALWSGEFFKTWGNGKP